MSFPTVDNIYTEGERSCSGVVYLDPYLYVLYYGGSPSYQPTVHKLNPATYEKIAQWTAPSGAAFAESMCTDCEHLYVGTSSYPSPYRPIHVFKVDPVTMTTVASWTSPTYRSQQWAEAMAFDFNSNRLLVVEDGGGYSYHRIYKFTQDLTLEMYKDADDGSPPWQYFGDDITILGDHCYIATGGTPGQIAKRLISDLSLVDYFEGYDYDPDDYIEGIFFNVCNDGENIYTATYDYSEYRPTRLIKVNPSDMTRVGTYYGAADELMAYGSYAYGGKVYMMLNGWDGVYSPNEQEGEQVLQIDPITMTKTARYQNWTGDWNDAYKAVGDGSRLHIGFWGGAGVLRSVLQFAEQGTELCAPTSGIVALGDKVMLCPIGNRSGNYIALKPDKAALTDKSLIAPLNNQAALKLDFRNCKSKQGDKIICVPISGTKKNILGLR